MECERKNKWIRGCHFVPRYDSRLPASIEASWLSIAALEALKTKVYVGDVCTSCGKTIKREGR